MRGRQQVKGRRFIVKLASSLILAVPFLFATFLVGEFVIRMRKPRDLYLQPCMTWNSPLYIQMYSPFCHSTMNVEGRTVEYSFNEHGLRDRPARSFTGPTIMVLGDSIAKGLMIPSSETIAAQFESLADGQVRFLNAGVRLAAPTTLSLLYKNLRGDYPVSGVMLIVNGTDVADERLAAALALERDEDSVPLSFVRRSRGAVNWRWTTKLQTWLGVESYLLGSVISHLRYRAWRPLVASSPGGPEILCGGIRRLARQAKLNGDPLAIVFTPHFASGIENIWAGGKFEMNDLQIMVNCARETGALVIDLSRDELQPEWFFDDRLHYRPAGTKWVVDRTASMIFSYFKIGAK